MVRTLPPVTEDRERSVRPVADRLDSLGPPVLPLVDGEPVPAVGETLVSFNPSTGDPIARVACLQTDQIDRAVISAASAHAFWKGTSYDERKSRLLKLADIVFERSEEIAGLISLEQGKPLVEALTMEVLPALDHLRFLARHAERLTSSEGIDPRHPHYAQKRAHFLYDSIGVIACVTPFNLPFSIPLIHVAAALAMGNSVVLKPSELAPLCGLRVGELMIDAGFPPGLVNVLHLAREDVLRLVAHRKVGKVFLTGRLETGQMVMATAGCAPRPVVLSLSGKHPCIVAHDAPLDKAARGIVWGAFSNAGQNCGAIERVYVDQRIAAKFVEVLLGEVDRLKVGDPLGEGVDMGPLISNDRRLQVHLQVTDAVERGARLLRGGKVTPPPGYFYPPTVVVGAPPDCRLMREETLGPVLPIVVVDNLERAIIQANDSDYALTASGWTSSATTAERLMVGLHAGVVTVNDALYSFGEPASTWSGYRRSGLGHTHGTAGLREMCRQKFTSFDPRPLEAPVFGFPYDEPAADLVQASLRSLHAPRGRQRLRGLLDLIRMKRFRLRVPLRFFLPAWKRLGR